MKRVFIVHGWDGSPSEGWFPWLKAELEKRGFSVQVPAMPHPEKPTIAEWVSALATAVGKPDAQTYFVGHSIGCQAIMRYVAGLPKGTQVAGAVFVAGWFTLSSVLNDAEQEVAREWVTTPIDTALVRSAIKRIAALFSETDTWVPLENKKLFEDRLASTTYIESCGGQGHFSGSDGVTELPKVLELVLEMSAAAMIGIDDVAKLEIKMGTIVTAAKVEGADKLLVFTVNFGAETRTIVSGVAQYYQPEAMVGKQVPVITNLAPRTMKGVESQGMIIYAIQEDEGGRRTIMLNPEKPVPPGSLVQ